MSLNTEQYIVSEGRMVISKMRVRQEEVEEEKKVVDVSTILLLLCCTDNGIVK